MTIPFHPLADLFPLLEGREFDELVASMRSNGFLPGEEIVLLDGQILDGRNRYRAATEAGIFDADVNPKTRWEFVNFSAAGIDGLFSEETIARGPLAWVLAKNLNRRHLSPSQLAAVAAEIGKLPQGRPQEWHVPSEKENNPASLPVLSHVQPDSSSPRSGEGANRLGAQPTQAERAEALGISERQVRTGDFVKEHAAPEVFDAVKRGDVAVSAAAEIARLPVADQLDILRSADPRAFSRVAKERRDVRQAEKRGRREERETALGAKQSALPQKRFGVIYADPEWRFEVFSRETGMDRAADNHYPTSSVETIKARPVGDIAADDCALFLWATAPMLPQALEVMSAWGFAYKSHFIWLKRDIGTGFWNRNQHELLLVGTRGDVPAPAMGTQFRSALAADQGEHSEKPDFGYEIIEAYFPTLPKIELNARRARAGWEAWGLEAPTEPLPETVAQLSPQQSVLATDFAGRQTSPGRAEVSADGHQSLVDADLEAQERWEIEASEESDLAETPIVGGEAESARGSASDGAPQEAGAAGLEATDALSSGFASREDANTAAPAPITREKAEPILRARYATTPGRVLAEEFGVSVNTVRTWAFHFGLTNVERRTRELVERNKARGNTTTKEEAT